MSIGPPSVSRAQLDRARVREGPARAALALLLAVHVGPVHAAGRVHVGRILAHHHALHRAVLHVRAGVVGRLQREGAARQVTELGQPHLERLLVHVVVTVHVVLVVRKAVAMYMVRPDLYSESCVSIIIIIGPV